MKNVLVVGGGFSGLVTAYYLAKRGHAVDLHEASSRLGGMLGTELTPHGLVESAANGFLLSDDLAELLADLKLDFISPLKEYKKKRFIFRGGLRRWPLGFFETVSLICKFGFRWVFLRKSVAPKNRETVWNWGLRNLGFSATKYLVSPGLQGIYASDARTLSAELILGPMFRAKKRGGRYRGTVSFAGGMQAIIDALEARLRQLGVRIHVNSAMTLTSLDKPCVVTVSAAAVSNIVRAVAPEVAAEFGSVEMLPVASVTVFYERAAEKIEGFGCLFPDGEKFKALGVLSNTFIFADRGPDYSETWIFGGTRSPEILAKPDLEILHLIQTERKRIFTSEAELVSTSPTELSEYRIHRWLMGLPHYTPELEARLDRLRLPKNLYLNGNYLGGIGLSKILSRSKELAASIESGERFL
jgi:oxygen-dependent protoporphyrinogen oxidase